MLVFTGASFSSSAIWHHSRILSGDKNPASRLGGDKYLENLNVQLALKSSLAKRLVQ